MGDVRTTQERGPNALGTGNISGPADFAICRATINRECEMEAVKINAGHDPNGNPLRAFIVLHEGEVIAVIDEGFQGSEPLREAFPEFVNGEAVEIKTTKSEYREFMKMGARLDEIRNRG